MRPCKSFSTKRGPTTLSPSRTINPLSWPPLKSCFRKIPPPQVVTIEDNRSRHERRAISVRPVTPEQMGLAGAAQLAKLQRTRTCTGPSFVADHILKPDSLAAKWSAPQDDLSKALRSTLPAKVRKTLLAADAAEVGAITSLALAQALNKLAKGPSLYDPARFPDRVLSPETLELKGRTLQGKKLAQFNRLLLRDAYPEEISTAPKTHFTPPENEESPYSMGLKACFGISSSWLRLLALQETENLFLIFLRFGHLIEFDTTDPHALSPQRLESFHYITKRPLAILALSILGEERL